MNAKHTRKLLNLYLDSASGFKIHDDAGNIYSIEEARDLVNSLPPRVADCNLAFVRLVRNNFDLAKTMAFYEKS